MAIGQKTGGRDFQTGESGNPRGRPSLPTELKELQKLSSIKLLKLLNDILYVKSGDLNFVDIDPNELVIKKMLVAVIQKIISTGDARGFELILKTLGLNPGKN